MKTSRKMLVVLTWSCSVVYLYSGGISGGFGSQADYRGLALSGLIISTAAMRGRSLVRSLVRLRRWFRGRPFLAECE